MTAVHERTAKRMPRILQWVRGGGLTTLLLALPLIVVFALFAWWPIVQGLLLSFQRTNFISSSWVGLANFERVLADPLLGQAVANTLVFMVLSLVFGFPLPIIVAAAIAEMRRGRTVASVFAFIPVIMPPVVSILLWKFFYRPGDEGLFNSVLGFVGIGPLPWLQSPALAMPSLVLEAIWAGFGFTTIIYLAALMLIRTELYEAAEVDGASILQRFWHITLPQLRGTMLVILLLQVIGTAQVFTEPYLMTGGGPANSTTTLLLMIFRYAFQFGDYGAATALSLLLALALGGFAILYALATRRWSSR